MPNINTSLLVMLGLRELYYRYMLDVAKEITTYKAARGCQIRFHKYMRIFLRSQTIQAMFV
jgi:hypothetical protein